MTFLRAPTAADLAALADRLAWLHRDAFSTKPWPAAEWARILADPHQAVWLHAPNGDPETADGVIAVMVAADFADIATIAVATSEQRKGIGAALLHYAMADLKRDGIKRMTLEVAEQNAPARALYEGAGFSEAAVRKHYYGRARHALVYSLNLADGG